MVRALHPDQDMSEDPQKEDEPLVSRVGPLTIDWPRSVGYFGGIGLAVALELVAPELALFVAVIPFVKLLKRKHATKIEKALAAIIEGAAKPLGGDAEATVRASDDEPEPRREPNGRTRHEDQLFWDAARAQPATD